MNSVERCSIVIFNIKINDNENTKGFIYIAENTTHLNT